MRSNTAIFPIPSPLSLIHIFNAAGKVALAATNRDGELFYTTDAARTFANRIVDAGFDGIFVSISNPCDVVCTEIWHLTGYDPKKIIGSGCGLDSARLRTEISKKVGVSPKSCLLYTSYACWDPS